jgi:hypothetical protein
MPTVEWLEEWARNQHYNDNNEELSRLIFKEILPAFSGHYVRFGPAKDGTPRYEVSVSGTVTHTVYIS